MKLQEIASRIAGHLKRFEADPKINGKRESGTTYQLEWYLTKADAARYLELLDGGAVGPHHALLQEVS